MIFRKNIDMKKIADYVIITTLSLQLGIVSGSNKSEGVYLKTDQSVKIYNTLSKDQIKSIFDTENSAVFILKEESLKKWSGEISNKCNLYVADIIDQTGLTILDIEQKRITESKKSYHAIYQHKYKGIEVLWSGLTLQIDKNTQRVLRIDLDRLGDIDLETIPTIQPNEAIAKACEGIKGQITNLEEIKSEIKIIPKIGDSSPRLIYEMIIKGLNDNDIPFMYYTLVTAQESATIVYKDNLIKDFMGENDFQLNANIYKENKYSGEENTYIKNATVKTPDGTYISNDQGLVDLTGQEGNTSYISLEGPWCKVKSKLIENGATPSFEMEIPNNTLTSINLNEHFDINHLSGFANINKMHDFIKEKIPSFTKIDTRMLMWVDYTTKSCGAFFNPENMSVNFHAEGTNGQGIMDGVHCNSMSGLKSVVTHEYGHAVNFLFFKEQGDPYGLLNGHLEEGYSDIWSFSQTHNPITGEGVSADDPSFNYRRYDLEPKVYPQDWNPNDVYSGGQIIAGVWWDIAEYVGSIDVMIDLFIETLFHLDDGPNGTEGEIFKKIFLSTLYADDDDNDLSNGTPHDDDIVFAFSRHGIISKAVTDMLPEYTGVKYNKSINGIMVYPSFGNDGNFKLVLTSGISDYNIKIFDITGREVAFEILKGKSNELDVALLTDQRQSTIYLIKVNTHDDREMTLKYIMHK